MTRKVATPFHSVAAPDRPNLSGVIIDQIIGSLIAGDLRPGDRLPSIEDLTSQFSVGRTSVREALKALDLVGLIEIRHGEGTFIRQDISRFVLKPLAWGILLDQAKVHELMETRRCVEGELAALAASRASQEEIAAIERALLQMGASLNDVDEYVTADLAFHLGVWAAAHNEVMSHILSGIVDLLKQTIQRVVSVPGTMEVGLTYHRPIYEAIANRDADSAAARMRNHLNYVETVMLQVLCDRVNQRSADGLDQ